MVLSEKVTQKLACETHEGNSDKETCCKRRRRRRPPASRRRQDPAPVGTSSGSWAPETPAPLVDLPCGQQFSAQLPPWVFAWIFLFTSDFQGLLKLYLVPASQLCRNFRTVDKLESVNVGRAETGQRRVFVEPVHDGAGLTRVTKP